MAAPRMLTFEAWQKMTTCQQCGKTLTPRERALGRLCDACVSKNKGRVWGKESDEDYQDEAANPCWSGYQMVGMKQQDGRPVPNCVPRREDTAADREGGPETRVKTYRRDTPGELDEAEYQGRPVTLNKPFRTPSGPKKFSVYVTNDKGNVVKVNFGDPHMEIKRDDPDRRKNFRARHHCDNPGPKWKARYWSCRFWSTPSVSKLTEVEKVDWTQNPLDTPPVHVERPKAPQQRKGLKRMKKTKTHTKGESFGYMADIT